MYLHSSKVYIYNILLFFLLVSVYSFKALLSSSSLIFPGNALSPLLCSTQVPILLLCRIYQPLSCFLLSTLNPLCFYHSSSWYMSGICMPSSTARLDSSVVECVLLIFSSPVLVHAYYKVISKWIIERMRKNIYQIIAVGKSLSCPK